jgi:hypothetical protein
VPVVVDRGAVRKKERSWFQSSSQQPFNNAVFHGLQEKIFAPFLDKLAECLPTSGWDGVKSFLYKCAGDIHHGENSILTNQWNKNSQDEYGKPSMVTEMAEKYEARLEQRDHDRCQFYATLAFDECVRPAAKTPNPTARQAQHGRRSGINHGIRKALFVVAFDNQIVTADAVPHRLPLSSGFRTSAYCTTAACPSCWCQGSAERNCCTCGSYFDQERRTARRCYAQTGQASPPAHGDQSTLRF